MTNNIMFLDQKTVAQASKLMDSVEIEPGDCVLVRGMSYAQILLEEIALIAYRRGGLPLIEYNSLNLQKSILLNRQISLKTLGQVPDHLLSLYENTNVFVNVELPGDNGVVKKIVDSDRIDAFNKSFDPLAEVMYGSNGKKAYDFTIKNKAQLLKDLRRIVNKPSLDKFKMKASAENVARCLNLKESECVFLKGGFFAQEFVEEIALSIL